MTALITTFYYIKMQMSIVGHDIPALTIECTIMQCIVNPTGLPHGASSRDHLYTNNLANRLIQNH